jgi:ABC-2 type transport system permease protein
VDLQTIESERKTARLDKIEKLPYQDVAESSSFFSGTWASISDVWAHRELLGRLVRREVKARYKDSTLGILWSLFRPLVQLLIYYFAIGKVLGAGRNTPDFAIFVFVGLTTWGLYAEIVAGGTTSILANSGLVKKVYLPREIFPLSAVGSALVNFGIQLIVLLAGILFLSHFRLAPDLLLAPLSFIVILVFGTALAILLGAINVYLRDVQHFVDIYLIVFFWASPIVYPFNLVHKALAGNWIEQIYLWNPVTIAIIGMQKALWSAGSAGKQYWPPDMSLRLLVVLVGSVVLLWISLRVFSRLQGNFAQEF